MLDFDIRIVLQIMGALLCITNYLLVQTHRLKATQPTSLLLVISSCAILLASATIGHDWGLILLEGTWLLMVATTLILRQRAADRAVVEPIEIADVVDFEPEAESEDEPEPIAQWRPEPATVPMAVAPVVRPRAMDPVVDPYSTGELQLAGVAG